MPGALFEAVKWVRHRAGRVPDGELLLTHDAAAHLDGAGGADRDRRGVGPGDLGMAAAQRGQASASARISKSCSGVIVRSTLLTNRAGAVAMSATVTARQGLICGIERVRHRAEVE